MLHGAVAKGKLKEVQKLLKISYTNVNERDKTLQTPLHAAVTSGNTPIAEALIGRQADVNAVDTNNWAPIHCAVSLGNLDMVELLLNHPKIKTDILSKDGTSMLHYLVRHKPDASNKDRYVRLLQQSIDRGADVNKHGKHGEVPLHQAVQRSNAISANFLLEHGANINAQNKLGESPLHYAVRHRDEEMIKLLMSRRPDLSVASKEGTALEIADDSIKHLLSFSPQTSQATSMYAERAALASGSLDSSKQQYHHSHSDLQRASSYLSAPPAKPPATGSLPPREVAPKPQQHSSQPQQQAPTMPAQQPSFQDPMQQQALMQQQYILLQQQMMVQQHQMQEQGQLGGPPVQAIPTVCVGCSNPFTYPPKAISINCPTCGAANDLRLVGQTHPLANPQVMMTIVMMQQQQQMQQQQMQQQQMQQQQMQQQQMQQQQMQQQQMQQQQMQQQQMQQQQMQQQQIQQQQQRETEAARAQAEAVAYAKARAEAEEAARREAAAAAATAKAHQAEEVLRRERQRLQEQEEEMSRLQEDQSDARSKSPRKRPNPLDTQLELKLNQQLLAGLVGGEKSPKKTATAQEVHEEPPRKPVVDTNTIRVRKSVQAQNAQQAIAALQARKAGAGRGATPSVAADNSAAEARTNSAAAVVSNPFIDGLADFGNAPAQPQSQPSNAAARPPSTRGRAPVDDDDATIRSGRAKPQLTPSEAARQKRISKRELENQLSSAQMYDGTQKGIDSGALSQAVSQLCMTTLSMSAEERERLRKEWEQELADS